MAKSARRAHLGRSAGSAAAPAQQIRATTPRASERLILRVGPAVTTAPFSAEPSCPGGPGREKSLVAPIPATSRQPA